MKHPGFDLKSLRYFISAVEAKSISGAASLCHIAQPSITLAINKLENELNCTLLHRHAKGVEPTEKGQEFYQLALELMSHAQSIQNRFSEDEEPLNLTLNVSKSIRVDYVGKILNSFAETNARPRLEIMMRDDAELRLTVKANTRKHEMFLPIASEKYCLLIPIDHLLAHRTSISLSDLAGVPFIERRSCENQALFDKVLAHLQLELNIVANVDTEEWALSLVRSGVGCTIAPIDKDFNDKQLKRVELSTLLSVEIPERQVGIAYGPELRADKQDLIEHIFQIG